MMRTSCVARGSVPAAARGLWDLRTVDLKAALREMGKEVERVERNFLRNGPLRFLVPRPIPIESRDGAYRVNIDAQGFEPEHIKIDLKGGVLKIHANMDKNSEEGGRIQQSIIREFSLPDNVDVSTVKSLLHSDGVLSIEASYNKPPAPKVIPIQSDDAARAAINNS